MELCPSRSKNLSPDGATIMCVINSVDLVTSSSCRYGEVCGPGVSSQYGDSSDSGHFSGLHTKQLNVLWLF